MGEVQQLPLFEGFRPDLTEAKLTGQAFAAPEHMTIGEAVYYLVRGVVVGVNHERKGEARVLVRSHKVKLLDAQRVDAEGTVADALVADAAAYLASLPLDTEPGESEAG